MCRAALTNCIGNTATPARRWQVCTPQDMHNDIQDVLGQNYGVPDDVDEDELLGELDALEADMAFEAEESAAQGAVPSYLQVRRVCSNRCVQGLDSLLMRRCSTGSAELKHKWVSRPLA